MLAVRGSGWSGNFPSQECNDVTEIVLSSLSSLALPLFFPPFCSSFFGTQNPFFSPPFFSSHPFASAVLFLTLLSSLYYFWMARSCEESPLSKVESHWCWIAERKGGRLEEGGDRGKPERDMPRVSPCIILRSFERKQRPPRGALPLLLCLWAPKNARSTDGIPVTIP